MSTNKPIYGTPEINIATCKKPDIAVLTTEAAAQVNYYNRRLLDIMKQISSINNQQDREQVVHRVALLKGEIALKVKLATDAAASTVAQSK
jgi:hypothetical protein